MALVDAILHNRIKESPHLQDENIRAMLLVLGVAALATAGIGKQFFEMDKMTASVTAGTGALLVTSAVTKADAPLCILAVVTVTGTGVAMVQAFRDGRFYVKVDLAELLRLAYDISKKKG
jgi:hypothetical protein